MGGLLKEKGEEQGAQGKIAPFLLPLDTGRTEGGPAASGPRPWGLGAAMEEGETEMRARGFYSPTYLEQRRSVEACPRWGAEVAEDGGGGGAAGVGGRAGGGG